MSPEQIAAFIAAHQWTFAKTMAAIPHEYVVKAKCRDPKEFEAFVIHIRTHGYPQKFFKRTFTYFDVGPHQYWTMGAPLEDTIIINRALKKS